MRLALKAQRSPLAWGIAPGFMIPQGMSAESAIHFRRRWNALSALVCATI